MWIAQCRLYDSARREWDSLQFRRMGCGHFFVPIKYASRWKTLPGAVRSLNKHIESRDVILPGLEWQYRLLNEETGEAVPWEIFG